MFLRSNSRVRLPGFEDSGFIWTNAQYRLVPSVWEDALRGPTFRLRVTRTHGPMTLLRDATHCPAVPLKYLYNVARPTPTSALCVPRVVPGPHKRISGRGTAHPAPAQGRRAGVDQKSTYSPNIVKFRSNQAQVNEKNRKGSIHERSTARAQANLPRPACRNS